MKNNLILTICILMAPVFCLNSGVGDVIIIDVTKEKKVKNEDKIVEEAKERAKNIHEALAIYKRYGRDYIQKDTFPEFLLRDLELFVSKEELDEFAKTKHYTEEQIKNEFNYNRLEREYISRIARGSGLFTQRQIEDYDEATERYFK